MLRRNFIATTAALAATPAFARPRLRAALCAYSFRKELAAKTMSHDDLIHQCVAAGVDGIDLTVYWFPNTSDEFLLPLRRLAYRNGVELYSIAIRSELTQSTAAGRDKEVANIRQWVDVAQKLGAGHIRVFGGRVPKDATEDQAVPWVVECLQRAQEYAGARGIILGLENHGGITTSAARILEIVKKVNSPWVGINLDTGNFTADPWRQIEQCTPYAVNVQVKTEMAGEPGKRVKQDWERMVKLLAASPYKGYLALEYEAAEPAPTAVPRLLGELNTLIRKYA